MTVDATHDLDQILHGKEMFKGHYGTVGNI